jgi:hypothetical protein
LQVRTLHISDFLKVGHMHQADIGLNLPFALVLPELPLPVALTPHLPVNNPPFFVYIYENEGDALAYGQVRFRQRRDEWEVQALGVVGKIEPVIIEVPRGGTGPLSAPPDSEAESSPVPVATATAEAAENEPEGFIKAWPDRIEDAWGRVLEHMISDAGEKGVARIYARLSVESPQFELFTGLGFHPFTHETLFYLPYLNAVERPAHLEMRSQRNRDTWYIQQLYSAITPSFVQHSEQSSSRSWEISRRYLPRSTREAGWLLLDQEHAVGYVRILSYRNRHLMRVIHLDTRRELLPDLVRFGLSTLKAGNDTQVYCIVREYQMEQEAILEDCGFTRTFSKQAVMVKHTVQFIRATERQLVRGRETKLELARSTLQD